MSRRFLAILFFVLSASAASAHSGDVGNAGFASGFLHPMLGWDHVAAMVAVGLWGAFLGAPAIWVLPVAFPLVMTLGAAAGRWVFRCRGSRPELQPLPLSSALRWRWQHGRRSG